ncbi:MULTISPECIES: hypothetical protein [unclassified Nostoc]|uniref:hypothetical protein n=1 Tax=unclassified Nostoc TaxID=2593658 RepID=UPI002AD24B77|nr:hypothetical protein [Nostoc sp. DedQUE03]MDZ7977268.1 hypothetical protein [Nostoc sp. DedQUE03]MDZ8047611.1 hypothetical protein [Nostoc sp. DedQUE02]
MSNLTVQAQIDASLVNRSESVPTEEINSSNTYHIPVVWKQVKKLIEMMKQVGVEWDGTINHLDSFHVKYRTAFDVDLYRAWCDLTPKKITNRNRDSLVYAPYTE